MIDKSRKEELEKLFWSESADEETQSWRGDLTVEELVFINKLEKDLDKGLKNLSLAFKKVMGGKLIV